MEKVRNIVFAIITAAFLWGAIAYQAADGLIPGFEANSKSFAEGRDLVKIESLAGMSFTEGLFQEEFEQFAADSIPCKDEAMLLNASLQRRPIAFAAALFSYDFYPTYFDSNQLVWVGRDRIVPMPTARPKSKTKSIKRLDSWCETINSSAKHHPDTRFVVNIATQVRQDDDNPSYGLVKSKELINADWLSSAWGERLSDDVVFLVDDIKGLDEVLELWFSTDHHWTLERALATYNRIGQELGWKEANWSDDDAVMVRSKWNGSNARYALDFELSSTLVDLATDFPDLKYFTMKGGARGDAAALGKREAFLDGSMGADDISEYSAYTDYYGNGNAWIENANSENDKTCLLVSDSMGFNIRRYIAQNYKTTITVFPGNNAVDKTLDWYIEEYGVDDVIVLTHAQSYDFIAQQSPNFLTSKE